MRAQRLIGHQRGQRYGEVLAIFERCGKFEADVYGTQLLNDCPEELWNGLDADAIRGDLGAAFIKLNGPRQWVLDGLGTKATPTEPVMHEFNGLAMRRIAVVKLGEKLITGSYVEIHVDRRAQFFYDAGKPVYELIDSDGAPYVMQALCMAVDPKMSEAMLGALGERLRMPDGWSYRVRVIDSELVVDTTDHLATVIQDEFENTYTRPY